VRRNIIERRLPSHEWPDHDLRITGVDIDTGELVVFTRESGVSLIDAVEASCAVPGAWPVVTIGGRRYMDGGMGGSVNMIAVKD
jgi:NTE family protein